MEELNKETIESKETKKSTAKSKPLTEDDIIQQRLKENEELVPYRLFYDGQRYKEPVVVIINGHNWVIQRGVEVMIPRKVAKILDQQIQQDAVATLNQRRLQDDFEKESEKYGIK